MAPTGKSSIEFIQALVFALAYFMCLAAMIITAIPNCTKSKNKKR